MENPQYEVTVYDTANEKVIYEKASVSFIAAAPEIMQGDDGKNYHDVHLMVANLHPKVTAEICLALIQSNDEVKSIFVETIQKLIESEGDSNA